MAGESDDPRALVSRDNPPAFTLVYPGVSRESEYSAEWSRIASELEQQEKNDDEEKQKEDDDQKDSSASSDTKLFRVDHVVDPSDEDPGEPIRLLFPISSELIKQERSYMEAPPGTVLESKMADEIDALYRLYGRGEVARLGDSLNAAYFANLKAFEEGYKDDTREESEKFSLRTDVSAGARMVGSVYVRQLRALDDRIREYQKLITVAAAKLADTKVVDAGTEILTEAKRYLPRARHVVSAQKALETDSNEYLAGGPDSPALREALARIQSRMMALENPPPATPGFFALVNPLATSPAEDAAHALEYEVSQACQRYPVLHRIWKEASFTRYADTERMIFSALSGTWRTNRRVRDTLVNRPEVVWLFPPLIHETLDILAEENAEYGDLGTGARAAQEQLEAQREDRFTETLAKIVGVLDVAVGFTSPAPPVALAIAGASLVLSLAASLAEYEQLSAESDAANATLDPRKALCSDPSFGFFALGIALSLLDLRAMRNAYKAARVTREVDDIGRLVREGT